MLKSRQKLSIGQGRDWNLYPGQAGISVGNWIPNLSWMHIAHGNAISLKSKLETHFYLKLACVSFLIITNIFDPH